MNIVVLRIERALTRLVDGVIQAWRAFLAAASPLATARVLPLGQPPSRAQATLVDMVRTDTTLRGLQSASAVLGDLRDLIVDIAEQVPADQLARSEAVLSAFNRLADSAGRRQIRSRRSRNRALFYRRFEQVRGNAVICRLVGDCQAIMDRQRSLNPSI